MNSIVRQVVDQNVSHWKHSHSSNPEALWGRIAVDLAITAEQVQKAERTALGSTDYIEKFTRNLEGVIKGEPSRSARVVSCSIQEIER